MSESNHKNTLKTAWNDITGDTIKTGKGSMTKYADNWEGIFGKKNVAGADFENGRILSEATQSPPPASLEEYLKQEREAQEHCTKLFGEELPMELGHFVVDDSHVIPMMAEEEYMCPNCVTPWKCNGPHIEEDSYDESHELFKGISASEEFTSEAAHKAFANLKPKFIEKERVIHVSPEGLVYRAYTWESLEPLSEQGKAWREGGAEAGEWVEFLSGAVG